MKYAIVEAGGKQFRAEEGQSLTVDLLPEKVGDNVTLDKVLMIVDGENVEVGTPYLKGALVKAKIVEQIKGKRFSSSSTSQGSSTASIQVTAKNTPDFWWILL